MDLTLESAFSTGGLIGHLSYLLLIISMLMRDISLLRILVIASALVAIFYDWFYLRDPVGVFWESLLVIVNVGQLLLLYWKDYRAKFSIDEAVFVANCLPGLSKGRSRDFLNAGVWKDVPDGTGLTVQDEVAGRLIYFASGGVDIFVDGNQVAKCEAGSFIGEMTVLHQQPATATSIVNQSSRIWEAPASNLLTLSASHPEIARELEASFARNYRDKLIHSNELISKGMLL